MARGTAWRVAAAVVWAGVLVSAATQVPPTRTGVPAAPVDVRQMLDRYCVGCHNQRAKTSATSSGVVLDTIDASRVGASGATANGALPDGAIWEKVVRKMRTGAMPPPGMPRPDAAMQERFVVHLEAALDREARERPNPGRPAPHRLNRAEYANAIRDLLALDVDPSALLPPDDSADGFDNNADVLGVSPALLERYLSAAAKLSALAVGSPSIGPSSETYRVRGDGSQGDHREGLPLGTRGGLLVRHTFPLDGEYVIKVKLLETNLGSIRGLEDQHQLEIAVDGDRRLLAPVGGADDYTRSSVNSTDVVNALDARLQVRVLVRAGQRPVAVAFLDKPSVLGGARLQPFERTTLIATDHLGWPHVESVTVSGPFNASSATGAGNASDVRSGTDTASRRRVFTCRPSAVSEESACARRIIATVARRAYRRPVTQSDLAPLLAFYETGRAQGTFDHGIELALRAVLVSPKFVFRVERDPAGGMGAPYRISDIELASRLSFFLWSSIPDDVLIETAARGQLGRPDVLEAQVRRMLADPKAEALVDNFAGQWLHVRNLRSATPDSNDFPNFDDNLRLAFERELELFVGSIVREDRSVLDLMTADHTFVNERLAKHYAIPNVYGSHFRRVMLTDEPRKGLLGKGGILLVTSHADRTSPVLRGKWILDNLIGTPPPPPPADVPPFPESGATPQTVRARMEAHRASPVCASCHRIMDPIGLALENFDAVGAWRSHEAGSPIDASGELGDGSRVDGVVTLREALLKRTYALGRGLEHHDMPAVRAITRAAARDGYRVSSLIREIVSSTPFRMRRPERPTGRLAQADRASQPTIDRER
jgi:hypothetical protein